MPSPSSSQFKTYTRRSNFFFALFFLFVKSFEINFFKGHLEAVRGLLGAQCFLSLAVQGVGLDSGPGKKPKYFQNMLAPPSVLTGNELPSGEEAVLRPLVQAVGLSKGLQHS